ncbi:MAG: hypothetical protein ACI84D_003890, partial [Thalassolituus oleivorans]
MEIAMLPRFLRLSLIGLILVAILPLPAFAQTTGQGTLRIEKLVDADGDGTADRPGDAVPFAVIDGAGAEVARGATDGAGLLSFGLRPGTYTVVDEGSAGLVHLDPSDGMRTVEVQENETAVAAFLNQVDRAGGTMAGIHGRKLDAATGDGLDGWTIVLSDDSGNEIARAVTGPEPATGEPGWYWFESLPDGSPIPAGSYVVREEAQAGWAPVNPADGEHHLTYQAGETVIRDFENGPGGGGGGGHGIHGQKFIIDVATGDAVPADGWTIILGLPDGT